MNKNSRRTDLVLEAHEIFKENEFREKPWKKQDDDGVIIENSGNDNMNVTRVKITTQEGEQKIGKPMGNYITIEVPDIKYNDRDLYEETCRMVAIELGKILKLNKNSTVLIVGLGNWNITPDALGPLTVDKVMVTRHLYEYLPDQVDEGVRSICAVSPGVLGITGIETGEIIKGIVDKVKPDVLIAIDSLASRKLERVNTTIQIADTGIAPGSGVGNRRMELTSQTLGIPVIAIGVPTVVDAATMANDAIDLVIDSLMKETGEENAFYKMLKDIDREQKYTMIRDVLESHMGGLVVTPKEIDEVVERLSKVIANGLNISLHDNIGLKDVDRYLN